MESRVYKGQQGVILVQVLLMLTLFGIVGVTFTFYAADDACERLAADMRDGTCTHTIGNRLIEDRSLRAAGRFARL